MRSNSSLGSKGLARVVVGPPLEPGDSVLGLPHGGQHEDRNRASSPQIGGEIQPGLAGHHQIEDDEVEGERE